MALLHGSVFSSLRGKLRSNCTSAISSLLLFHEITTQPMAAHNDDPISTQQCLAGMIVENRTTQQLRYLLYPFKISKSCPWSKNFSGNVIFATKFFTSALCK
ncbi:hypothetical protein A1G_06635 [Rickettsia rickettsii str. 'Sheila Smith']|uniref:Uncharacterized protein n=1 Tax=Rickettsia rickettsii (strain Sheila Smith) TaxID=392021 RepID=A0A0H3AZF4_RICRS|nr:hypothetical protein A1G_06635 [Rickettsia rickettsii str. 'Sheila Smith']